MAAQASSSEKPARSEPSEFLSGRGSGAVLVAARRRRAPPRRPRPTITYWNGLTGADGKVMDELIDQFTRETGIRSSSSASRGRISTRSFRSSVPAGEGPDLALIHTVEVPHFASDGVLEVIDEGVLGSKGFRAADYLPATWQGGTYEGKRYSIALDVPQHLLYLNVKVMKEAGLVGSDGRPRCRAAATSSSRWRSRWPRATASASRIGTVDPGRYTWGFHNLLWQNGANVFTPDLKRSALADPAAVEVAEFWASLFAAQDRAAVERELPRRLHRRQARHVDRRLLELHRAPRGQGRLHRRAGPAALQAAGGLVDAAPVHLPQAEGGRGRQARRGVDAYPLDDRPRGGVDAQGRPGLGVAEGAQ